MKLHHIPAVFQPYPMIELGYGKDTAGIQWDIVNNLDGFFIRMPVAKLGYFDGMQHVDTKWDILNIQKN